MCRLMEEREMDASVCVTVVEIYNEKIKDLLLEGSVSSNFFQGLNYACTFTKLLIGGYYAARGSSE